MNVEGELRIGDAEREAAAAALGEHFASGRLTHEEYDERSARVWSARTNADLLPLFEDLPAVGRRQPQPRAGEPGPGWRQTSQGTAPVHPRGDRLTFPWLPVVLVVVGLSILLPGPWWLILLGAFVFSRSLRHGCHARSRSWAGRR